MKNIVVEKGVVITREAFDKLSNNSKYLFAANWIKIRIGRMPLVTLLTEARKNGLEDYIDWEDFKKLDEDG